MAVGLGYSGLMAGGLVAGFSAYEPLSMATLVTSPVTSIGADLLPDGFAGKSVSEGALAQKLRAKKINAPPRTIAEMMRFMSC